MKARYGLAVAAVLALALAGAGCGDDEDSGGSSGPKREQVKLGISTASTDIVNLVGEAKGFFEQAGVDVDVETNTAANTPTLVTSGQIDLGGYSSTSPLQTNLQGRRTSIVYGISGGGVGGVTVAQPDGPDTLEALRDVDDCRMGAFPPGTSSYGAAAYFNESLKLGCDIVPFQDPPAILGALAAGRISVAVSGYTNLSTAIDQHKVKMVLDTRKPEVRAKYVGENIPEVVFFGMRDKLQGKKDAIARWLRGYQTARRYVADPANADAVVGILKKVDDFAPMSEDQIKRNVLDTFLAYMPAGGDDGRIAQGTWDTALKRYAGWKVPNFDQSASAVSYGQAVDMSYLDQASK